MPVESIRELWRMFVALVLILLVPILPFIFLGDAFELQMENWLKAQQGTSAIIAMTVILLGADIFLPIPSSGICTFAGGKLGVLNATLASFTGLSLGCCVGYFLARIFGEGLIQRFMSEADYQLIKHYAKDYGMQLVALTRPLPILAEATVLIVGAGKLSWVKFMLAMLSTNLILAMIYSLLGAYFKETNSLPLAILAAVLVPILLTFLTRRLLPKMLMQGES